MLVVLALPAALPVRRRDLLGGDGVAGLGVVVQRHHGPGPDARGQRGHHHVDQGPAAAAPWVFRPRAAVADDVARTPAAPGPARRGAPGVLGTVAAWLAVAAGLAIATGLAVAARLAGLTGLAVAAGLSGLAGLPGLAVLGLAVLGLPVLGRSVLGRSVLRRPISGLPVPGLAERRGWLAGSRLAVPGLARPGLGVSALRGASLAVASLAIISLAVTSLAVTSLGTARLAAEAQARQAVLGLARSRTVLSLKSLLRQTLLLRLSVTEVRARRSLVPGCRAADHPRPGLSRCLPVRRAHPAQPGSPRRPARHQRAGPAGPRPGWVTTHPYAPAAGPHSGPDLLASVSPLPGSQPTLPRCPDERPAREPPVLRQPPVSTTSLDVS